MIRDGKYLELTPKTFDVLQMLVERPGEVVTKDEMLGRVWDGRFVEEGNLAVYICRLRRLLETTGNRRFIETVHGTGYRFVSHVIFVDNEEWPEDLTANNHLFPRSMHEDLAFDSAGDTPDGLTFWVGRIRLQNQNLMIRMEVGSERQTRP